VKGFQWVILGLERVPGVLKGVQRGPTRPPGPLELSALLEAAAEREAVDGRDDRHRQVLEDLHSRAVESLLTKPHSILGHMENHYGATDQGMPQQNGSTGRV
jgi:hypothetical protein